MPLGLPYDDEEEQRRLGVRNGAMRPGVKMPTPEPAKHPIGDGGGGGVTYEHAFSPLYRAAAEDPAVGDLLSRRNAAFREGDTAQFWSLDSRMQRQYEDWMKRDPNWA